MEIFINSWLFYGCVVLEVFEQGRKELEALLNREVSATEDVRKFEIQCWFEGVKEEAKKFS